MVSLGSFLEQVPYRQITVPLILHSWSPSQTGASASFMKWQVIQHAHPHGTQQQIMYHSPGWSHGVFFWPESFLPMQ